MLLGAWVLLVATHVNAGAVLTVQEFGTHDACEHAAAAARQLTEDAASVLGAARPHTWCVPKGNG